MKIKLITSLLLIFILFTEISFAKIYPDNTYYSEKEIYKQMCKSMENYTFNNSTYYLCLPFNSEEEDPRNKAKRILNNINDSGLGFPYEYYRHCVYQEKRFRTSKLDEWENFANVKMYKFHFSGHPSISYRKNAKFLKRLKKEAKKLKQKNKYKTVKNIYAYVIKRIKKYRYNQSDPYKAFYKRVGNCDTYANLFYLLCRYAGVPCKGVHNNVHIWNIVKLKGKWYYCDACWDDGFKKYNFFLRGKKDFKRHKNIDPEFYSKKFKKKFKIAKWKY